MSGGSERIHQSRRTLSRPGPGASHLSPLPEALPESMVLVHENVWAWPQYLDPGIVACDADCDTRPKPAWRVCEVVRCW